MITIPSRDRFVRTMKRALLVIALLPTLAASCPDGNNNGNQNTNGNENNNNNSNTSDNVLGVTNGLIMTVDNPGFVIAMTNVSTLDADAEPAARLDPASDATDIEINSAGQLLVLTNSLEIYSEAANVDSNVPNRTVAGAGDSLLASASQMTLDVGRDILYAMIQTDGDAGHIAVFEGTKENSFDAGVPAARTINNAAFNDTVNIGIMKSMPNDELWVVYNDDGDDDNTFDRRILVFEEASTLEDDAEPARSIRFSELSFDLFGLGDFTVDSEGRLLILGALQINSSLKTVVATYAGAASLDGTVDADTLLHITGTPAAIAVDSAGTGYVGVIAGPIQVFDDIATLEGEIEPTRSFSATLDDGFFLSPSPFILIE